MRIRGTLVLGLGLAVVLAGCGGGTDEQEAGAGAVNSPVSGAVTYESWTPTQKTMDALVAGFKQANAGVTVSSKLAPYEDYKTSLQTELRAGTGPDVFVVQPGADFNQFRQYMEPLDSYAKASAGDGWAGVYRPAALSRGQVEGTTLGLPVGYGLAGFLWVNKTVLAAAGVSVPTTYDELVAASKTLVSRGYAPVALGAKDTWQDLDYFMAIANATDTKALYAALDESGKWTAAPLVQAFAAWKKYFDDGVFQKGAVGAATYNDTYDLFTKGKAGFFANGSWNLDMYTNSAALVGKYDLDVVPLPVGGATAPITGDVSGIVVVNKAGKNKAAAFKLAEYMSGGPGSQILMDAFLDFPVTAKGGSPSKLDAAAKPARASIEKLVADHFAGYRQVPSPAVAEALGQALIGVAAGSATPEQAAQRVQDAAESN